MFGIMQHLDVVVFKDADEAIANGYNYDPEKYRPVEIDKAVVVKEGTQQGNSTVDLVMIDEKGNKYVCLITGRLLKMLDIKE